jgi:Lrp/AsnC family leucine-responsive transcriptional regulator
VDAIDRKILGLYQRDTRRIANSIGDEVGLSAAAVQRRLKRLRKTGVIQAELALLDNRAIGMPITCIVALKMASAPSRLDRFRRQLQEHSQVQQCYQVTGSQDFVVIISAASMEHYGEFARQWFEGNEQVARFETHVVLERVKVGLTLPVDTETQAVKTVRPQRLKSAKRR